MNNLNLSKLGNNIRLANPTLICRMKTEKKRYFIILTYICNVHIMYAR